MKRSRTARATFALMLCMMVSVWLAPSAHAQLGGGIGDAVGGIGDAVGGGSGDGSGSGGGIVGEITDGLEGGSNDSGSDGGTTEEGSGGGGLVGGIVDGIKETVDSGKDSVDEVTKETTETVGNVGGGLVGTVDETVDKVKKTLTGTGTKKQRNTRPEGRRDTSSPTGDADVLAHTYAGALEADGKAVSTAIAEGKTFSAEPTSAISNESVVSQIGRIASEAAEQVAFPLALTLLVIGFLMVQNRIDRKDPKLALAPVDSEHDLLSFT